MRNDEIEYIDCTHMFDSMIEFIEIAHDMNDDINFRFWIITGPL